MLKAITITALAVAPLLAQPEVVLRGELLDGKTKAPIANAVVQLLRVSFRRGQRQVSFGGGRAARSGVDGTVSVAVLEGDYVLEIAVPASVGEEEQYGRRLWPVGDNLDYAVPISARNTPLVDIGGMFLERRKPSRVDAKIVPLVCAPEGVYQVVLSQTLGDAKFEFGARKGRCDEVIHFENLSRGTYEVVVTAGELREESAVGVASITIDTDAQNRSVEIPVQPPVAIVGRVQFSDGHILTPEEAELMSQLQIKLWPRGIFRNSQIASIPTFDPFQVTSTGEFAARTFQPTGGEIQVVPFRLPADWVIESMTYSGGRVTDDTFVLNAASVAQVLTVKLAKAVVILGTVQNGTSAARPSSVILVALPVEGGLAYPRRVKETSVDANGVFQIGVLPGIYGMVAVDAADRERLEAPGVLASMAGKTTFDVKNAGALYESTVVVPLVKF